MSDAYAGPKADTRPATGGYRKPLPKIDAWNKPFWAATREHRFIAQRDDAGNVWFPPGPVSPFTRSDRWEWIDLSGRGTVVSWVVFHQKYFAGFGDELPYDVALVQLDEGPRIFTNLSAIALADIRIGQRVEVVFNEVNDEIAMPVFRPLAETKP